MTLSTHPAVAAFIDRLGREYEIKDVVDEDGNVSVFPMNPPYPTLEYTAPFVDDLIRFLTDAGFRRTGGPGSYKYEGHGLTAWIENVDADPEDGDPIQVDFFEA